MITQERTHERASENRVLAGRCYYHPGEKTFATFLKTSAETGGEHTLIEVEVAPGGGTSRHLHKSYTEQFEVLQGTLTVKVGSETRTLGPGARANVPQNTLHNFRNRTSRPTTFQVELRPGSEGFEKTLKVAYGLANDGRRLKLSYLALLLEWGDIGLPSVFTVITPLLRVLARRARQQGVDRELETRYCT